jgi:uncharacterized protein YjiK
MGRQWIAVVVAGIAAIGADARAAGLDLSRYRVSAPIALPGPISEASAVTFNWNTGTLFVLGAEGDALTQVTRAGALVDSMTLSGFDDTEGVTYVGNGRFVLNEERLRDAYRVTYAAGGNAARAGLPSVDLGTTVGNIGIEGISYEQSTGMFYTVKEVAPQEVKQWTLDFDAGTASGSDLFVPNLGVLDLGDIQVLGSVTSLQGASAAQNLLILRQASSLLMEVDRSGAIVSSLDLSPYSLNAEGVTIEPNGTIYVVGESYQAPGPMGLPITVEASAMFVLTPVPEPETYALMAAGLALLGWRYRCGSRSA